MRILVESSTYHCRNAGDLAMMLVAVERIANLCPGAEIRMVTADADALRTLFPGALPVSSVTRQAWLDSGALLGRHHERLPDPVSRIVRKLEHRVWTSAPKLSACGMRLKQCVMGRGRIDPSGFPDEIRGSDLVVGCGMGSLNDAFRDHALGLLEVYATGIRHGVPVVLFGQGIGPITDPDLRTRAMEVLPRVQFIGLREGEFALPLLASLGTPTCNVEVTGDDAIELSFRRRRQEPGNGIGVNVRVAPYAGIDHEFVMQIRRALEDAAHEYGAPLVPVPISTCGDDSDARHLERLAAQSPQTWRGEFDPGDPLRIIDQTGACRVVIAASYHAAVFALSQGIPVVCMHNSEYYSRKFNGLRSQFGAGCTVLRTGDPCFGGRLEEGIDDAWRSADRLREPLLRAAVLQIEKGRAAYSRVLEKVRDTKHSAAAAR